MKNSCKFYIVSVQVKAFYGQLHIFEFAYGVKLFETIQGGDCNSQTDCYHRLRFCINARCRARLVISLVLLDVLTNLIHVTESIVSCDGL